MTSIAMLADCGEIMPQIPDGYYDLAIVDPPYGLGIRSFDGGGWAQKWRDLARQKDTVSTPEILQAMTAEQQFEPLLKKKRKLGSKFKHAHSYNHKQWDKETPTAEYFYQLFRVSKHQVIWGANYFPLPPCRCNLVWDKMQTVDNFSAFELAWTSFDKPSAIFRHANHGFFRDLKTIHPTQKPIALYTWILTRFAKPGWRILDTHLGSGTHRMAAWSLGFDFFGMEVDPDYFEPADKAFRYYASEPELFNTAETYTGVQTQLFNL